MLEFLLYGLVLLSGSAILINGGLHRFNIKAFLPSKTFRGSPEDLDPNEVAVSLAITRMLRNIDKITEVYSDTLCYRDDKISSFRFTTCRHFAADDFTKSKFHISLQVGGKSITLEGVQPKIAGQILSARNLYKAREEQKKKEAANAQAFAVIEALTDTGLPVKVEDTIAKGEPFTR